MVVQSSITIRPILRIPILMSKNTLTAALGGSGRIGGFLLVNVGAELGSVASVLATAPPASSVASSLGFAAYLASHSSSAHKGRADLSFG